MITNIVVIMMEVLVDRRHRNRRRKFRMTTTIFWNKRTTLLAPSSVFSLSFCHYHWQCISRSVKLKFFFFRINCYFKVKLKKTEINVVLASFRTLSSHSMMMLTVIDFVLVPWKITFRSNVDSSCERKQILLWFLTKKNCLIRTLTKV